MWTTLTIIISNLTWFQVTFTDMSVNQANKIGRNMLTVWLLCQWGSGVCVTVPFPSAQYERKLIRITKRYWTFLKTLNIFILPLVMKGKLNNHMASCCRHPKSNTKLLTFINLSSKVVLLNHFVMDPLKMNPFFLPMEKKLHAHRKFTDNFRQVRVTHSQN